MELKQYYLVGLDDPESAVLLDAEDAVNAYKEALALLGYGIVVKADGEDES